MLFIGQCSEYVTTSRVLAIDSDVAMLWNDDAMWWCATDDASFGVL